MTPVTGTPGQIVSQWAGRICGFIIYTPRSVLCIARGAWAGIALNLKIRRFLKWLRKPDDHSKN